MLNGQQMGGRRRSAYFYDLWCGAVAVAARTAAAHCWLPAALAELGAGVGTHPAAAVVALANLLKFSPIAGHAGA